MNEEREKALAELRELLPPGSEVSTVLRHVSRSGMTRAISPVLVRDGEAWDFSYHATRIGLGSIDRNHGGLRVHGAGMDMGFWLVYELGSALYPAGFDCIGDNGDPLAGAIRGRGCPANDHSNGDRDYTPHLHRDGGYALRHRWL
jgi:hypothetical protein